jgi:predicted DNA-binding protein
MKKNIAGKLYNTQTATCIGSWAETNSDNDINFCEESLYLKATGEFFLFGKGGSKTKYANNKGNNIWTDGEDIVPLSYNAAGEWAGSHLEEEDYESVFGEILEDDTLTTVSISIPVSSHQKLKRMSRRWGKSVSAIIQELVENESVVNRRKIVLSKESQEYLEKNGIQAPIQNSAYETELKKIQNVMTKLGIESK